MPGWLQGPVSSGDVCVAEANVQTPSVGALPSCQLMQQNCAGGLLWTSYGGTHSLIVDGPLINCIDLVWFKIRKRCPSQALGTCPQWNVQFLTIKPKQPQLPPGTRQPSSKVPLTNPNSPIPSVPKGNTASQALSQSPVKKKKVMQIALKVNTFGLIWTGLEVNSKVNGLVYTEV